MLLSFECVILRFIAIIWFILKYAAGLTGGLHSSNLSLPLGQSQAAGSRGRWRSDSVNKDNDLRLASSRVNVLNKRAVFHDVYKAPNVTTTTTNTMPPTPNPLVDPSAKEQIMWFDDSLTYGLNATYDYRFKLRRAPLPRMGSPWPMPQSYVTSNISHLVNSESLSLTLTGFSCPILHGYFQRIKRNVFGKCEQSGETEFSQSSGTDAALHSLSVTVLKKCTRYPYLEMDESYDLVIKSSSATIISKEVWGALRGMETFSQLIYQDRGGQYWINETVIQDFPRFKHRGLLLDTSRHYLRKEVIIDNLEAMAQNKLNVFHWHIVDDQSFPYESKVFPLLTKLGAYDAQTHIYTHEDIEEIIEEARVRGIRVIPEFDTPGHTFSWGFGQRHLLTPCYDYYGKPNGKYGPVNPTLKKNYRFLKALFQEVLSVFKDQYIHLGGDEVPFDCWLSNPFIKKFMSRNRVTDVRKVLNLYERELLKSIVEIGRSRKVGSGYIVWQEVFDNEVKLNPDAIVQVWSGDAYNVERVTNAGLKAIFSTCWYLDYISYGQDWDKYYRCDQLTYRKLNETLFIGGEVCMWAEFVDNEGITPRIWPRASAAAERLWSNQGVTNVHKAAPRIEAHRCRMLKSGLKVGVLSGPGYCPEYKHQRTMPCNDHQTANNKEDLHRLIGMQSSSSIIIFLVIVIIALLLIIILSVVLAQRRFISTIVHATTGGTVQRQLILVFVLFSSSWFIWWIVRQAWIYH